MATEGPLTRHLRSWVEHLTPRENSPVQLRLMRSLQGNKVSLVACFATLCLAVCDVVASRSLLTAQVAIRLALGVYSCVYAQIILLQRLDLLLECLALVINAVATIEQIADVASRTQMATTARRGKQRYRFYMGYTVASEVVVMTTLASQPLRWVLMLWPEGDPTWQRVLHGAVLPVQGYAVLCCLIAGYTFVPLALDIYSSCADLYCVLGRRLEVAPCRATSAALQAAVLRASLLADTAISDLLPHLMVVILILPLVSTVEVISNGGRADVFAVGTAPLVMTIFVPLCLAGDRLAVSREGVAVCAARGPWLRETPNQRSMRRGVVQAAGGSGAQLRGRGMGPLNREACMDALRSWFSFLQMVVNLRHKSMYTM